jgi:hypothetical protein
MARYRKEADALNSQTDPSKNGAPEVGAAIYANSGGTYRIGALQYGYYDDEGRATLDVDYGASGYVSFWHAHPRGDMSDTLSGHIQNLKDIGRGAIWTTINGHDLYKQWILNGIVYPTWDDRSYPPIPALCKDCIP